MSEGLDKLASGLGKAIEAVPEFYEDGLQPTVQETGKLVARIPRAINAIFSGLDRWILAKEYSIEETKKLLEKKLENVEPEKIVEPEPYVAVPAIQAISYSMNSNELRNLYANLLAKSMYADTKDSVHPSFVEIIKQLSPLDAQVFKTIMEQSDTPIIDLQLENKSGHVKTLETNVTALNINPIEGVKVSIDNLKRQNLINIPEDSFYSDESLYLPILNSAYFRRQKSRHQTIINGFEFSYQKRCIEKTNLGHSFYQICITDL